MTTPDLARVRTAEDNLKSTVLDVVNRLLDNYYEEHPTAKAYGQEYDGSGDIVGGTWFLGRENGANGAENDAGVDFIYRRHPNPENPREQEYDYLFGDYGWPRGRDELFDHLEVFDAVLESGVEDEYITSDDIERVHLATENLEETVREVREEVSLEDISNLVHEHDTETLKTLLVNDDEDGRVVWQMLNSKDENGDYIENPVKTPVVDEEAGLMFVRSERYFHDERREPDGKWYAYGVVIGRDDTDEVFFVHRLESDPDLRNEDYEWTVARVRKKMGFDLDYDELAIEDIPFQTTVRIQGDLAFQRKDFHTAKWERFDDIFESDRSQAVGDHLSDFLDANPAFKEHDDLYVSEFNMRVKARPDNTDELKELQEDLGFSEETVREVFDTRLEYDDISRLTAKRRAQVIEDLVRERIFEWTYENTEVSEEELEAEAEQQVEEEFDEPNQQVNAVLGNHTVMIGPAIEHPLSGRRGDGELSTVVVPDRASGYIWHDEHESKKITLPQGVYEFRFLEGHEDQFWMN